MNLAIEHPLPNIENRDLQDMVFTHTSAEGLPRRQTEDEHPSKSNLRLAFLGDSVLHMVVSAVLEVTRPLSRPGDLTTKRSLLINQDRVASWADAYGLPKKLVVPQSQLSLIPKNPNAKVEVFQAYLGALFKEKGYEAVEEWFSPVVEKALNEILTMEDEQLIADFSSTTIAGRSSSISSSQKPFSRTQSLGTSPATPVSSVPTTSSAPLTASARPTTAARTIINSPTVPNSPIAPNSPTMLATEPSAALALFNQRCDQRHLRPEWRISQEGLAHAPVFTATVTLPGHSTPIGTGIGNSKNKAKQQAAEKALQAVAGL